MDKSKFLFFFGSIFFVCLICSLGLRDSNGYIHSRHANVCQFLNFSRELSETQIHKSIIDVINEKADQNTYAQEYFLFFFSYILSKYINPFKSQKIMCSPFEKRSNIFIYHQKNISPSIGNCPPCQALQIINTSIIRS